MRVATYARYSSDQQRAASIADQQRLCREFAARQGWMVTAEYADAATSGASLIRPGIQALMREARMGAFDMVLAESLDRFSRDQEDTAGLFKRLTFSGVRVVTVSEGDIGHLHVGLKGTMNALYLHELAEKTRRGLRGRVEAGKSGGGRSYGYRSIPGVERGDLAIEPTEASIVERIFRAYVADVSPKAIARTLNAEGVSGPQGAAWSPSTIHGHTGRGTGILNNELYIGRRVWNRLRYLKDPDTGKRISRLNPASQWITTDVPHLRIIPDDLWQAVKARQAQTRYTMREGMERVRRPKYLFSGLTKCALCGGGYTLSSNSRLTCFNAHERGTCSNRRSIRRDELEARVLRAMQERFFDPEMFTTFCEGFTAEMTALRRDHVMKAAGARRELHAVERRQQEIVKAVSDGYRSEVWKVELLELDRRKAALLASTAKPTFPPLHPHMAAVFRQKAATLAEALGRDALRDTARQALRGFLDTILIPPGDALLQVTGNVGAMLNAASEKESLRATVGIDGCGGRI